MFRQPWKTGAEVLSEGIETLMQRLMQEKQIANEAANRQATLGLKKQEFELEKQKLPFTIAHLKSQSRAEDALAEQRKNNPGGRGGVDIQNYNALLEQAKIDNPGVDNEKASQIVSAWLDGSPTLADGSPTPQMTGSAKQKLTNVQRRNSNAQVQNTAANMSVLATDVNDIDIAPVAHFAGLKGKLDIAGNIAKMASGQEVPQEFRDYVSFKNVTSNFAMDALRKGFGTSVVPEYVYATLGKASQPNSAWWFDPKQVYNDWNKTKEWINKNAKHYRTLARKGLISEENSEQDNKSTGSMSDVENGLMTIIDSDGNEHKIFRDKLEDAKKRDPGLKVKKEKFGG